MAGRGQWRLRPMVVLAVGVTVGFSGMPTAGADSRRDVDAELAGIVPVVLRPELPGPSDESRFGNAVAVDGVTLLAGMPAADSARVYVASGGSWVLQATLSPSDGAANGTFGADVAIDGDTAIIGASGAEPGGAAYVFVRSGSTWTQQAKLISSVVDDNPANGTAVALQGDQAIVGVPGAGVDPSGAVAVFTRSGTTWTERALLAYADPDPLRPDNFGTAVAQDGETLVVGPYASDDRSFGRVYVYSGSGAHWTLEGVLQPRGDDPIPKADAFGRALDVDGGTIVVSAPRGPVDGVDDAGAAYVFERRGSRWRKVARLTAPEPLPQEELGTALALDGGDLALGAPFEWNYPETISQGRVFLFHRKPDASWRQTQELHPADQLGSEWYGFSVDLDHTAAGQATLAVGAPHPGGRHIDGAIYLYRR